MDYVYIFSTILGVKMLKHTGSYLPKKIHIYPVQPLPTCTSSILVQQEWYNQEGNVPDVRAFEIQGQRDGSGFPLPRASISWDR